MSLKNQYNAAFYQNQKLGSIKSANKVLSALQPVIGDVSSVIDIGCGAGGWLRTAGEIYPQARLLGVDHPDVPKGEMFIEPSQFRGHDLSQPLNVDERFDLAISLEVAEHISPDHSEVFVDNLARHADKIIFSAALPRQGGTGHVNEQWPDYWTAKWKSLGFELLDIIRPVIWDDPDVAFWYKQNAMLFVREGVKISRGDLACWGGRAMVHPDCWMKKTEPFGDKVLRVVRGEKPAH